MRRRFMWRALLFVVGVAVIASLVSSMVGHLTGRPGPHGGAPGWFFHPVLAVLIVLALIMIVAGPRTYGRMAGPVEDVMAALGRAADGDFSARVPERGSAEGRTLARAFNAMAGRVEQEDERRRALFTDVSHELRTPLAVLQGTLEGMLDGVYPRDDEHLTRGLEEAQALTRLVEDLRTLATAESAALRLSKTPTDLGALAADVVASFNGEARAADVTLAVDVVPGPAPAAEIDPDRIRQVLTNLVGNALRYTPAGGTVTVRCEDAGDGRVAVTVEDTGRGIAPEDLPHVFDRFYKSKESRGTGLGLAIAKSLVQAHGGEISAQSEPGRGTAIRFVLPRRDASA
jgi:two-component system, OmpR family, sensor histidine kinase BaeS